MNHWIRQHNSIINFYIRPFGKIEADQCIMQPKLDHQTMQLYVDLTMIYEGGPKGKMENDIYVWAHDSNRWYDGKITKKPIVCDLAAVDINSEIYKDITVMWYTVTHNEKGNNDRVYKLRLVFDNYARI